MSNLNGLFLIMSSLTFLLIPARHQDRVIDRGSQLNCSKYDTRHKGNRCSRVVHDCHVDENGKFNRNLQNEWKRERFEYHQNDEEDDDQRCGIYMHEVHIRDIHQVMRQRSLADQHRAAVVLLQNAVDLVYLLIDFIRACVVGRAYKHQLILVTLQHFSHIRRNHGIRNRRTDERVQAQNIVHTVHIVDLIYDRHLVLDRCILVHDYDVHRAASEIIFNLLLRHHGRQGFRKGSRHIVIVLYMVVAVHRRDKEHKKNNKPYFVVLRNKIRRLVEFSEERPVGRLLNRLVEQENQRRKHGDTGEHSEDNALCHYQSHIKAKGKGHEAQCDESGDCRHRTANDRFERIGNGMSHRTVLVPGKSFFIFTVASQKEDRIVRRDTQLQDRGDRLRDIGNRSEDHIGSHVIYDGKTDVHQEEERHQERISQQKHCYQAQDYSDCDVNRELLIRQITKIVHDCRNTADVGVLFYDGTDLIDGFHRGICG